MYCVLDKGKLIAFHDSRKVVEKYAYSIRKVHKVDLEVCKLKKESKYKLKGHDDLYLVRYHNTYVQSGYLIYLEITETKNLDDEEFAKEILLRILEIENITDKQRKKIRKVVKILDSIIGDAKLFVPTLSQLNVMKLDYDPYLYNQGLL